jgi:hypothetical protein
MEEMIRLRIQRTKERIAEIQKEMKESNNPSWYDGYLFGLERQLDTLEDILFGWEQYQKHGDVIPF